MTKRYPAVPIPINAMKNEMTNGETHMYDLGKKDDFLDLGLIDPYNGARDFTKVSQILNDLCVRVFSFNADDMLNVGIRSKI